MLAESPGQVSAIAIDRTRKPIDIEHLLHWAYAQTAYVDYRNGSARSLAFNHQYSAIPRGCHNLFTGGDLAVTLLSASAEDAKTIVAAVEMFDQSTRDIVTRCAKDQNRPDCFVGVEAQEVESRVYPNLRRRKGWRRKSHKPVVSKRWEPCHPLAICAARGIYGRWHTAVSQLGEVLDGNLSDWHVTGFSAPATPWLEAV